MFFKAHFSALQHGKKENHRPKEVYLKAVSCLHQRNHRDFLSRDRERHWKKCMIVAIIPSNPSLAINSPYSYNKILSDSRNKPKPVDMRFYGGNHLHKIEQAKVDSKP